MSVNKELLEMGLKGEVAILEYFKKFGFDAEQNKTDPLDKRSVLDNLRFGDITLEYKSLRLGIDVKMGHFISQSSISSFNGMFYILIPNADVDNIEKAKVVKSSTVKSYYKKVPEKYRHIAASGSIGYRFTKLKNYMYLDDFVIEYIKRIVIMDNTYDEGARYENWKKGPFTDLLRSFNKVYPKGVEPK